MARTATATPGEQRGRSLLAARRRLRLELGFALLEFGFALGALFGLFLRRRFAFFLGFFGLVLGFLAGLRFAPLVFGFALRQFGGGFLLCLLRRFGACFGLGLALRLALPEFFLFPRQLELELFLLIRELRARLGLLARCFLGLLALLLLGLRVGLVVDCCAAQLGDLALGERGVDAGRELLHVKLEVVRVGAVLDRAPELELDFLVARRACRSACRRRRPPPKAAAVAPDAWKVARSSRRRWSCPSPLPRPGPLARASARRRNPSPTGSGSPHSSTAPCSPRRRRKASPRC